MLVDHLNFVYWSGGWWGGGECSRELCPTKCNYRIDLELLNINKISNYNYKRLLNVNCISPETLRFIISLRKILNPEEKVARQYVTTKEYSKAEQLWLVFIQQDVTKIANYKQKKI